MKRFWSLLLTLLLLVTCLTAAFSFNPMKASAASTDPKRVIAIVFDNSGSMYMSSRTRWCHATYAMEVFATMMNDSDEMYIYPMHPITVGNDSTTYDEDNPLMITRASAQKIREIYTEDAGGTPSTSAEKAISKLQSQSIPENNKWLVILSDGEFSDRNTSTVAKLCADSVNTMFLGMEFEPPQLSGTAYAYTAKKAESGATLSALSAMCNEIFGRDDLASFGNKYVSGSADSVNFDVPMKKLIVFVQGTDIANIKLGSLSPKNNVMMQYSTKGSGDYNCVYDDSLQGQLLTFENVPAGTYDLSFSGTQSSVAVYYEPNVKLEIALTDATGNTVDPNGELYPGDYVFTYGMVDTDGNSVNSELVGNTDYNITYTHNGSEQIIGDTQSGTFSLAMGANDTLDVNGSVTYLKTKARPLGYTEYYTSADLGWPSGGLTFAPPPAGYLEIKITGGESSYNLTSFDANAPVYRVEFIYEGAALSGSDLDRVDASASVSGGSVGCKLEKDATGYYVTTSLTTSLLDAQVGNYEITVSGTYTNEDGLNTNTPSAATGFELVDNSGQITMELDVQQDYFLIKDLENGKPIKVKLLLNGVPLTDEQLANTKLTTSVEGLTLKYEPVNGESAFKVWIDPDHKPEPGKYKITIGASTKNEIGREVYSEQETKVQVRNLPQWLRVLIPIVSILAVLILIWLFMNMKVLPKKLRMTDITFMVKGKRIESTLDGVRYSGKGKRATISITTPDYQDYRASISAIVSAEAISPRYLPSSKRKLKITDIKILDEEGIRNFSFDGNNYTWHAASGKYLASGASPEDPFEPFLVAGDFDFNVSKSLKGFSASYNTRIGIE